MKSCANILNLILLLIISSCKDANVKSVFVENTKEKSVVINNNTDDEACFQIYINGENPLSLNGIHQLSGIPLQFTDSICNVLEVFYFVCKNTYHKDIQSSDKNVYNPVIGLYSLGGGLCSMRSGALTNLLRMNRYYAYSIVLQGHVVTIVKVYGRNIVLDPDFGVFYYNQKGQIASYEELCSQPELIINPINPILDESAPEFFKAYSAETAAMYSSLEDNVVLNTGFTYFSDYENDVFVIPPGTKVTFPLFPKINPYRWAFVKITLPAGSIGNVFAPLVPAAIVGKCKFVFNDKEFKIDEILYNDLKNLQIGQFEIMENFDGVAIYYLINPKIVFRDNNYLLELRTIYGETPEIAQFENPNSRFNVLKNDLLDSCLKANLQKSLSLRNSDTFDNCFENLIWFCETDSVIRDFFLWDSLRLDYRNLKSINNLGKSKDITYVKSDLLRQFFVNRFIFQTYFFE
jgi:hypothetical protein